MSDEQRFTIRYRAGTYAGGRTVWAEDQEHAVARVRAFVRREMSLAMYSESYEVVSTDGGKVEP